MVDEKVGVGRFGYVTYSKEQAEVGARIRHHAENICAIIESELPSSRETSLALTKLEEAVMWANKALRYGTKQERITEAPAPTRV